MVTNLHHLAILILLGHERIGSIVRVGTCQSQDNACRVEFYIFVWAYCTDPDFRRSCHNMKGKPGDAWPFQVDYRNFLAVHLRRSPLLYSATFCPKSYWTAASMRTVVALCCCPFQSQLRSYPNRFICFLEFEDWKYSFFLHYLPEWELQSLAPFAFYLFCFEMRCLPLLQILLFKFYNSLILKSLNRLKSEGIRDDSLIIDLTD